MIRNLGAGSQDLGSGVHNPGSVVIGPFRRDQPYSSDQFVFLRYMRLVTTDSKISWLLATDFAGYDGLSGLRRVRQTTMDSAGSVGFGWCNGQNPWSGAGGRDPGSGGRGI